MKRADRGETFKALKRAVCTGALLLLVACAPQTAARTRPEATATPSPSPSSTPTVARSPTGTPAPAATPTVTPEPTATPSPTGTSLPAPTPTPTTAVTATHTPPPPPIACPVLPTGGFLTIWTSDPDLQSALGCPFDPHPRRVPAAWPVQTAYQPFERGAMIWSDRVAWYPQPVIYVLGVDGTYRRYDDRFDPAVDPVSGEETPPGGLLEPAYGFGQVWRDQPGIREQLGWATAAETPGEGVFQMFLGGSMVWISQTGQTYVFCSESLAVRVFDTPFSGEPEHQSP
jgi:hypothetical protein